MPRSRRHRAAAAAALAVSLVACAAPLAVTGASASPARAGKAPAADQLRSIERARLRALVAGDTAAAAGRRMAPAFQAINPAGVVLTREDFLGAIDAGALDFLALEPSSPMVVRMAGSSATLRYRTSFDLVVGGTRLTHEGWTTLLYERRRGAWRVVWQQTTAVPNDPALLIEALKPRG